MEGLSPDSPYLAAGTMAGAADSSSYTSDQELPIVGECPSTERFNRFSWGKTGSGTEESSTGLIAGGVVHGGNRENMLQNYEETEKAPVVRLTKHTGPVCGLDFNPNLLASAASTPNVNSEVYLHSLVTDLSLSRSTEFQTAMQDGDKSSLRVLCEKKSEEAKSEDDRETWGFLELWFEDDGTAKTKLLTHLGFSVHEEKVQENLSDAINALGLDGKITNETESTQDETLSPTDNGEDFVNNLQSPKADPSPLSSVDNFTDQLGSVPSEEQMQQELDGQGVASSLDDSIRRALVVGDYKGAVSQCISANKMADALVIANLGGASLWECTRDQYLKKSYSSYLKVVSAMVNNDLMSLVNTRPLDSWKETLALLCNFADKEWTVLCDSLASRLMAVGNTIAATLCYICAGNVEKTVEIWSQSLKVTHIVEDNFLQDLMEKTIILTLATGQKRFSVLSKLVENYAELLASQGLLTTAMEYLKLLGSEESSQELAILQERIALSAEENGAPKHSPSEHAQQQNESVYDGADQLGFDMNSGSQQKYYQPQRHQTTAAAAPYAENYQQQYGASYGGAYATPTPYQPTPSTPCQPGSTQMFVPSPEPQVSQPNFPSSVVTQHQTQYQQPSLGSQLYAAMEQDLTEAIYKANWDCSECGEKNLGEADKDEHQLRHEREKRLAEIEEERKAARLREEERVKQDQMRAQASLDKILREEQRKKGYINKDQRVNEILDRRPQRKRNSGREEWESVRKLGKGGRR